jgi:hypothetical protein
MNLNNQKDHSNKSLSNEGEQMAGVIKPIKTIIKIKKGLY